jgi:hypothetical protein
VVLVENKSKGSGVTLQTGIPFLDHIVAKWRKNPGLMAYKLQSNILVAADPHVDAVRVAAVCVAPPVRRL